MTIESELLEITDVTTYEDVERVAYHFGFKKEPWPTLRLTGEVFRVSHEEIRQSVESHLKRISEMGGIPSLKRCYDVMKTKNYWLPSELRAQILELGLAGEDFRVESLFHLMEHPVIKQLAPDFSYCMYLPEPKGRSLKKRPRSGKWSADEYLIVLNPLAEVVGAALKEARGYPNTFGLVKMSDLMRSDKMRDLDDGSNEFAIVEELVGFLVRSSGKYWHSDFGGETWYVARRAASSSKMPQNRLRTYSEKVFSEVESVPVGKLAISYCNALEDRSKERYHVPLRVMEEYLWSSEHFKVVDGRVTFGRTGAQLSDVEKNAVKFLKEIEECESPALREYLLGLHPDQGSTIEKVIYSSPLVFVDEGDGSSPFRFSWIGWEEKEWESESRHRQAEDLSEEAKEREMARLWQRLKDLDETDGRSEKKVRLEQHWLRRILLGKQQRATCALCGEEFPVEALWVAHKKVRRACSEEERKDIKVVMPLCVFGCDFLYEHRYVRVVDRKVVEGHPLSENEAAAQYLGKLLDLDKELAAKWWDGSESYFAWGWS